MAAARDGDDIHSFLSASGVRLQRPSPRSSAEEFSNSHTSLSLLTSPPYVEISTFSHPSFSKAHQNFLSMKIENPQRPQDPKTQATSTGPLQPENQTRLLRIM